MGPSPYIIVDRRIYILLNVTLTFTGTVPNIGDRLLREGADAFRALPISSVLSTLTATINNTAVSVNLSDVIHPMSRYNSMVEGIREGYWSLSPDAFDQSQRYQDLFGANRNPLGTYGDSLDGAQMGRGGFHITSFTNPAAVAGPQALTATVNALLCEPLFLSPFYFQAEEKAGLYGVQTLDFNFTFNNDLSRMWSRDNANSAVALTSANIAVNFNAATLLFNYITPKEAMKLPENGVVYPYYVIDRYPTNLGANVAPTAITTMQSANIQLNSVPHRMYILARKRNSDLTLTDPDTYFGIENVSIQFGNRSGLLSSATQQDLYKMSVKNGVKMNWTQWSGTSPTFDNGATIGTVGSVLALDFGDDIGLDSTLAPGALGTFQLQMSVTIRNVNQVDNINPTLYIIIVSAGSFTIMENRSIAQIGVITRNDILNAEEEPQRIIYDAHDLYGGSFYSKIKGYLKKGKKQYEKYIKPFVPVAEDVLLAAQPELAPEIAAERGVRKALGLGNVMGRGVIGGRKMSKAEMKRRLRM